MNVDARASIGPPEYINVCNRCLQIERDERKHRNRYLDKAKDTIRGHAEKFKMSPKTFSLVHQWKAEQIAHDIEHAEKNGCCYCFHPFAEMGHGLADITVDHYDPRFPPVYGANTRICCATCNKKKGDMTPEQWAQVCLAFRLQEGFLPLLLDDQLPPAPLGQMSLFTPQQWAGIPRKKKDEPG